MADMTAEFKFGKLNVLYGAAQIANQTLLVYLMGALSVADAAIAAGEAFLSNSGNGQTWTKQPSIGSLTPVIAFELLSELLQRYNSAKTYLINGGNATPSEAQIFSQMVSALEAITETMQDRSRGYLL